MSLRILSFNVRCAVANDGQNSWRFRRDAAAKLITSRAPDVVGLQEAYENQNRDLLERLPDYAMIGIGREDGAAGGEFATILYRRDRFSVVDQATYWFSETPLMPGSMGWGARCPRICTWSVLQPADAVWTFSIYNLHLDHESQLARERAVDILLAGIFADAPSVVTGDFNAGESNPAVERMRKAGFRDTYRALHPNDPEPGTYHGFGDKPQPEKIDYVWVSPHWSVIEAEIVRERIDGRLPSDHYAVFAELSYDFGAAAP